MIIHTLGRWLPHRSRKKSTRCNTVLLHATAGSSLSGAVETLKERGLSYHYIIEKSGEIAKCAPSAAVAFHAGESHGPQGAACNEYTIGISFVNWNDGEDPYSDEQFKACQELIEALRAAFPLEFLTTHYWVSPGRKTDPLGFPIEALAKAVQLQIWEPKAHIPTPV